MISLRITTKTCPNDYHNMLSLRSTTKTCVDDYSNMLCYHSETQLKPVSMSITIYCDITQKHN